MKVPHLDKVVMIALLALPRWSHQRSRTESAILVPGERMRHRHNTCIRVEDGHGQICRDSKSQNPWRPSRAV